MPVRYDIPASLVFMLLAKPAAKTLLAVVRLVHRLAENDAGAKQQLAIIRVAAETLASGHGCRRG